MYLFQFRLTFYLFHTLYCHFFFIIHCRTRYNVKNTSQNVLRKLQIAAHRDRASLIKPGFASGSYDDNGSFPLEVTTIPEALFVIYKADAAALSLRASGYVAFH